MFAHVAFAALAAATFGTASASSVPNYAGRQLSLTQEQAGNLRRSRRVWRAHMLSLRWTTSPGPRPTVSRTQNASLALDRSLAAASSTSGASTSPAAGNIYEVDATPDPHHAWPCVQVKRSNIPLAGKGAFAACAFQNQTLLGEYRGVRFMMGEHGANKKLQADWSYIWKVPRCKAPPAPSPQTVVITRDDKTMAHECSSHNGFVYVDAKPLDGEKENPMRYVNGVAAPRDMESKGQASQSNVDAFFADDRVWYYTSKPVQLGEELIVDYGPAYWGEQKEIDENQPGGKQDEFDMDWSNFQSDD